MHYKFREEANQVVPAVFMVILAGMLFMQLRMPGSLSDRIGMLTIIALGFAGAVSLTFRSTVIIITPRALEQRVRLGPFRRTRRYPIEEVSIRVEAFSFEPWDPHIAVRCGDNTIRVGWGLSEERLHQLATEMNGRIAAGG